MTELVNDPDTAIRKASAMFPETEARRQHNQGSQDDADREDDARRAFQLLRPLCTQLLHIPTGAVASPTDLLHSLESLLADVPLSGLQPCMEYVLFPLFLLLDAAVATRSSAGHTTVNLIRDTTAEGVLSCLEMLLRRCPVQSHDQMATVLRKLSGAAALLPSQASEEFRHGAVKCLRATFLSLKPCGDSRCVCHLLSTPPLHNDELQFYVQYVATASMKVAEAGDSQIVNGCLLASFHSEGMASTIGYILDLLLKISEGEAVRGALGSSKLRGDALSTLRALLWKVGSADALSFFLPGVASSLVKGMRIAKKHGASSIPSYTSGAAGSPVALEESLRAMAEIILFVLGDAQNSATSQDGLPSQALSVELPNSLVSVDVALARLRAVSVSLQKGSESESRSPAIMTESTFGPSGIEGKQKQQAIEASTSKVSIDPDVADFRLERDKEWVQSTTGNINKLLTRVMPLLCAHPAPTIRLTVVDVTSLFLKACTRTLANCTQLLLECLLSLACDDWKQVACAACTHLAALVSVSYHSMPRHSPRQENGLEDMSLKSLSVGLVDVMGRLVDKLPRSLYLSDEKVAVLYARQLAAAMFFAGPDTVSLELLNSPVLIARFVNAMTQCLSFSTALSGSFSHLLTVDHAHVGSSSSNVYTPLIEDVSPKQLPTMQSVGDVTAVDKLPRMPPWLVRTGGSSLYTNVSYILRLAGLSAATGMSDGVAVLKIVEPLLDTLRQIARESDSRNVIAQTRSGAMFGAGHHVRTAATAVVLLNEIIYGASGVWTDALFAMFGHSAPSEAFIFGQGWLPSAGLTTPAVVHYLFEGWGQTDRNLGRKSIVNLVGDVIHDYMVSEIWDPFSDGSLVDENGGTPLSLTEDIGMLQQVLVEGLGVFALSLGKLFDDHGFLGLVLYALLERLGCGSNNVSNAADVVLRTICMHCGYSSVKALVMVNADHIIDSLCRQLRHFALYPNAPNLLAAILRHTGAAHDLLPLLEEPMRSVQLELEIPARQQHPQYTVPLLRGLREISKAAQQEGLLAASRAAGCAQRVLEASRLSLEERDQALDEAVVELEDREKSCRCIGSIAASCILTCGPLLASKEQQICLLALDTVEYGISSLAGFEAIQGVDKSTKQYVKEHRSIPEANHESDNVGMKLLPTMHRLWPHLVTTLQHRKSSVVIRALAVIATATHQCGGEFFARRMKKDALPFIVKLLHNQPFTGTVSKMMLYRSSESVFTGRNVQGDPRGREHHSSSVEVAQVQEAVLQCVTSIAGRKKSAPALEGVVGVLASWILGLGCMVPSMYDRVSEALVALSQIDGDLVWILVADVAYSAADRSDHSVLSRGEFSQLAEILPPPKSPKDALWVHYVEGDTVLDMDSKCAAKLLPTIRGC